MDEQRLLDIVNHIEGWLTQNEIQVLYKLALESKGPILEVGSWKGKSMTAILYGNYYGNKNKVVSIDTFMGSKDHPPSTTKTLLEEFTYNIHNNELPIEYVDSIIEIKQGQSRFKIPELKDKTINFAFIDASHIITSVISDFALTYPKLTKDAVIAFHDSTNWHGPKHFCEMLSNFFTKKEVVDSITIFRMEDYIGDKMLSMRTKIYRGDGLKWD
jgi:hypothetical protein